MWKKGIRVIVSFVVVLLVWQIACTVTNANATLFPSPVKVGEEFVKLFTQGLEGSTSHVTLPGHIRISLLRFATGYVLAAVSAILLGLILGSLSDYTSDPAQTYCMPYPRRPVLYSRILPDSALRCGGGTACRWNLL